jgi:hypothetical protein
MSYRFADPNGPLINLLGTETAAGGSVQFYNYGTTTPKPTYADRDLTTPNPNPVPIDVSGRLSVEVWLDGEYTALLRDQDANVVWTRDVVPEVPPGATVPDPSGQDGKVLKSDGSVLVYDALLELPDPTGASGEMVVVNSTGDGYVTQPIPDLPEAPDPEIVVSQTNKSFRAGVSTDTTKFMILVGTDTAPANPGGTSTTKTVTYAEAFTVCWGAFAFPTSNSNIAPIVCYGTAPAGTSSASFGFDAAEGNPGDAGIANPVPFVYIAIGTKTVT